MLKIPEEGKEDILTQLRDVWLSTLKVGLYRTAYAPADGDTLATYTALEATFPGYARLTVPFTGVTPISDGAGRWGIETVWLEWTRSAGAGSEAIGGYFVTNAAETKVKWAELNPAGLFTIDTAGQVFRVKVRFTFRSEA